MILGLTYVDARSQVGTLILDVLATESISLEGDVTRYPVEDGTEISDHITVQSEKVSVSGLVSHLDMIEAGDIFSGGDISVGKTRIIDAIDALRQLRDARTLISVITGLGIYTDMAIANARVNRTKENGNYVDIQIDLVKIVKVTLRQADLPPEKAAPSVKEKTGSTRQKAGQTSKSVSDSPSPKSSGQRASYAKDIRDGKININSFIPGRQ